MKRLCAKAALDLVPDHGIIGLGGGETISYLAEYIKEARKGVKVVTPQTVDKVPVFAGTFTMSTVFLV